MKRHNSYKEGDGIDHLQTGSTLTSIIVCNTRKTKSYTTSRRSDSKSQSTYNQLVATAAYSLHITKIVDNVWFEILKQVGELDIDSLFALACCNHYMRRVAFQSIPSVAFHLNWYTVMGQLSKFSDRLLYMHQLIHVKQILYPRITDSSLSRMAFITSLYCNSWDRLITEDTIMSLPLLDTLEPSRMITDRIFTNRRLREELKTLLLPAESNITDHGIQSTKRLTRLRLSNHHTLYNVSIAFTKQLQYLDLSFNYHLTDAILLKFTQLYSLIIDHNPNITNDGIIGLTNLEHLTIMDATSLTVHLFSRLKKLRTIELGEDTKEMGISFDSFYKLKKLERLTLPICYRREMENIFTTNRMLIVVYE